MLIPRRDVGGFASEVLARCAVSRGERLQRGAMYRNLYLTGDENGDTATYNKSYAFINNLSSYLYSPVELRFSIEHYEPVTPVLRAMTETAESELAKYVRRGGLDTVLQDAVTWSLVKGKTFVKALWSESGLEPTLIQPEMMGVYREDLNDLNEQDAFTHRTYLTPERVSQMVRNHPDRDEILKKIRSYVSISKADDSPEKQNALKAIILGGLNPYQTSGGGRNTRKAVVDWINGPYPNLSPEVLARLVPLDELWIWDDERDEWTTIQMIGEDIILSGKDRHRNLIADPFDPANTKVATKPSARNPLARHQPFIEICPNRMDGYFWGRSELCNVGLLQKAINNRMDGINGLLRRQEKPPIFFSGVQGVTQKQMSALSKPGGMMSDAGPNSKAQVLAPDLPAGLFESLSQFNEMFNDMAGFAPILSGRGEVGVRSQAQAEELVKNATPRFKTRALLVERQVEVGGDLTLRMLKAHLAFQFKAWVNADDAGVYDAPTNPVTDTPPIPMTKPVEFLLHQLPDSSRVVVDSHSSSPAFSAESRGLMMELAAGGIMPPEILVEHLNPPGSIEIIESIRRGEAQEQQFAKDNPEIYAEAKYGKKRKR